MKKFILITLAIGTIALLARLCLVASAHAQSVDQATQELARTETALRTGITTTNEKAKALQDHLTTPDTKSLPSDVEEFLNTTARLSRLRDELRERITDLDTATTRTLVAFDQERASITDPVTRRAMTGLRAQARQQSAARLSQARAALDHLGRVLDQGQDVAHAARCVQLAEELNQHNAALDETVQRATDEAATYTTMTTDLLARLTAPATE